MSFSDPHAVLELTSMDLLFLQEWHGDVVGFSILSDVIEEDEQGGDLANVASAYSAVSEGNTVDTSLDIVPQDEAEYIEDP